MGRNILYFSVIVFFQRHTHSDRWLKKITRKPSGIIKWPFEHNQFRSVPFTESTPAINTIQIVLGYLYVFPRLVIMSSFLEFEILVHMSLFCPGSPQSVCEPYLSSSLLVLPGTISPLTLVPNDSGREVLLWSIALKPVIWANSKKALFLMTAMSDTSP